MKNERHFFHKTHRHICGQNNTGAEKSNQHRTENLRTYINRNTPPDFQPRQTFIPLRQKNRIRHRHCALTDSTDKPAIIADFYQNRQNHTCQPNNRPYTGHSSYQIRILWRLRSRTPPLSGQTCKSVFLRKILHKKSSIPAHYMKIFHIWIFQFNLPSAP